MNVILRFLVSALTALAAWASASGCTSALVGATATADGRMLLWKHRDTGHQENFVDRVAATDSTLAYVALFNAGDSLRREAWIGFNEAGFAVMNTASYNLAPDTARVRDREGIVMTEALRRCRRFGDFTALLDSAIASGPLGVQANFGAFDAEGDGGYVECSDHTYTVYPLALAPEGAIIRSNYSFSGGKERRLGAVRQCDAEALLAEPLRERSVRPETFTEGLSRSFYHAGEGRDLSADGAMRVADRGEMIPRRISSASVVIEGPLPGENPAETMVMWVSLGFPPASHVEPAMLDSVAPALLPSEPGCRAPLSSEMLSVRDSLFSRRNASSPWMLDLTRLRPLIEDGRRASAEGYRRGRALRDNRISESSTE